MQATNIGDIAVLDAAEKILGSVIMEVYRSGKVPRGIDLDSAIKQLTGIHRAKETAQGAKQREVQRQAIRVAETRILTAIAKVVEGCPRCLAAVRKM